MKERGITKKLNRLIFLSLLSLAAFVMTNNTAFAAMVHTDAWDTGDLLEWSPAGANAEVSVETTGGNPGGYLKTRSTIPWSYGYQAGAYTEKTELSGDYGFAPLITVSVDLKFFDATNFSGAYLRFRYLDAHFNGWIKLLTASPPLNVWQTYTVTINPIWTDSEARSAGWLTDHDLDPTADPSQSFSITMGNVYHPQVRLRGDDNIEAGIDNFSLSAVIFHADFENDTIDSEPLSANAIGEIELLNSTANGNLMLVQGPTSGFNTNSLLIHREAQTGNSPIFRAWPVDVVQSPYYSPYTSGTYTITWSSLSEQANGDFGFAAAGTFGGYSAFTVNYVNDGRIVYQDGDFNQGTTSPGPYFVDTGVTYTPGVPNTFTAVLDLDNLAFNLYIDGLLVGSDRNFQNALFTDLGYFWLYPNLSIAKKSVKWLYSLV